MPQPPIVLGDALLASGEHAAAGLQQKSLEPVRGSTNGPSEYSNQINSEPNRDLLFNKIDRLQRTNVRLMEKVDFLRDHVAQLTQELQKKSQLIQVSNSSA